MRQKGRPILAAFQFLSRFPVRAELDFTPELLKRSAKYYPLVGAAIGIVIWIIGVVASLALPVLPVSVILLIAWVWLTGGLHLDGWMDSADAFLSYRPREKMLEIMKDSRVGAMGVLACVLLLLFKMSMLATLLSRGLYVSGAAMMTAPVWSRWFMSLAMRHWPTARGGEGLAGRFRGQSGKDTLLATLLALVLSAGLLLLAAVLQWGDMNMIIPMVYYVLAPLLAWGVGSWMASRMSARLGGLTGDTYGAINEGLEAVLLLLACLLFQ
ncbi:adenosylcobinamide-GDP ribazoletransferase [Paenibacillus motobuensis]|uniref:Adenosylcobinamide-GDP ribazoletransferase n=1 Tax=Paenibacillus motobuensis TaxID=295324 RepID=A0ABN0Y504_9BACL